MRAERRHRACAPRFVDRPRREIVALAGLQVLDDGRDFVAERIGPRQGERLGRKRVDHPARDRGGHGEVRCRDRLTGVAQLVASGMGPPEAQERAPGP